MLRMRVGFHVCMRYYFTLSLCTCTTKRALYLSLPVFRFLIVIIIRPPNMLAFVRILLIGTNANDFLASRPSIPSFTAS